MKRPLRSFAIAFRWPAIAMVLGSFVLSAAVAADGDTTSKIDPRDWPYWRGPEGNSISRETGLPDTINPDGGEGSNLLWKRADLGSRATPIVMNGRLYTIARANPATPLEAERVLCLDAATGETIWESVHNMWSSDVPDTRVGWSSVVGDPETGNVYSLGGAGLLQCHDGKTGEILWQIPLHEYLGVLSTYGGRTNFPIVVDDVLIVPSVIINWGDLAVPAHRFIGFDKKTGEIRWLTSTKLRPEDTIYSARRRLGRRLHLCDSAADRQDRVGICVVSPRHQHFANG
jgi:outer membrane protein assembly factor BamB